MKRLLFALLFLVIGCTFTHPIRAKLCECTSNTECSTGYRCTSEFCGSCVANPVYCNKTCACSCTPTFNGGYCSGSCCSIDCPCECSPNASGGSCIRCSATPIITPTSAPTTAPLSSCNIITDSYKCIGDNSYQCKLDGTYKWLYVATCVNFCPSPNQTYKCQGYAGGNGQCCPATGNYCVTKCDAILCPVAGEKHILCYSSYADFILDDPLPAYAPPYTTIPLHPPVCVTSSLACDTCSPLTDTCGGNAFNCPAITGDPDSVSHIDNCNNVYCGPPCITPTGGPGPCTPNCSCAANICFGGGSCPDGCGGTCFGYKACSGTLTARAVAVTASTTSCNDITTSTSYLAGTTISFNPAVLPASQTQGAGVLTWSNISTDGTSVYTVQSTPPSPHALGNVCVSQNGGVWTQNASGTLTDAGTLAYAVGFLPQKGWFQTSVGNVYAAGQLTSSIPSTATNPYVSLVGAGGTAGIVSYGTGYDFSLSAGDLGETQVSTTGWLVNQSYTPVNYFERFNYALRNATQTAIIDSLDSLTQPSCATSPCIFTIEGNVITAPSSPWIIGANEQIIMLVNGNATISSNITITSGGFFAIIANGNITIDSAVDTLHGIYIASTDTAAGMFISGAGTTQLTVKGSVIADRFSLLRDLDTLNDTTPGEIFELDPALLFAMPDSFKEAPYVWREVAP